MKISMFDKVLAISLVLTVFGVSLKAALNTNDKPVMNQKEQVENKVTNKVEKQKKVDYNQIREDYQWDLEGAGDLEEGFHSWD